MPGEPLKLTRSEIFAAEVVPGLELAPELAPAPWEVPGVEVVPALPGLSVAALPHPAARSAHAAMAA